MGVCADGKLTGGGVAGELDHVVVLVGQDRDTLQGTQQAFAIDLQLATKALGNQLPVIRVGAIQTPTGEHLISPLEDDLTAVAEEADGIAATAAGEQTLQFAQGTGGNGDIQFGFTARGVLKTQDGQTVTIGGGAFEAVLIETEMHTGQQLFGLVAAAGEQGGAQPLN